MGMPRLLLKFSTKLQLLSLLKAKAMLNNLLNQPFMFKLPRLKLAVHMVSFQLLKCRN